MRLIRVLVVEGDPCDARLLREALAEIAESHSPGLHATHVQELEHAVALLHDAPFHVVLLDLGLPGSQGLHSLLELRAQFPGIPVVTLAAEDDEALAVSAVREGAQDFLVKSEIDCAPLARSLRHAIERHRTAQALRSVSLTDELTGLFSPQGFSTLAGHDLALARHWNRDLCILLADLDPADGTPGRNWQLMKAADRLREAFPETAVIGRLDKDRFAVAALDLPPSELGACAGRLRAGLRFRIGTAQRSAAPQASLEELLFMAQESLCENKAGGREFHTAQVP